MISGGFRFASSDERTVDAELLMAKLATELRSVRRAALS